MGSTGGDVWEGASLADASGYDGEHRVTMGSTGGDVWEGASLADASGYDGEHRATMGQWDAGHDDKTNVFFPAA